MPTEMPYNYQYGQEEDEDALYHEDGGGGTVEPIQDNTSAPKQPEPYRSPVEDSQPQAPSAPSAPAPTFTELQDAGRARPPMPSAAPVTSGPGPQIISEGAEHFTPPTNPYGSESEQFANLQRRAKGYGVDLPNADLGFLNERAGALPWDQWDAEVQGRYGRSSALPMVQTLMGGPPMITETVNQFSPQPETAFDSTMFQPSPLDGGDQGNAGPTPYEPAYTPDYAPLVTSPSIGPITETVDQFTPGAGPETDAEPTTPEQNPYGDAQAQLANVASRAKGLGVNVPETDLEELNELAKGMQWDQWDAEVQRRYGAATPESAPPASPDAPVAPPASGGPTDAGPAPAPPAAGPNAPSPSLDVLSTLMSGVNGEGAGSELAGATNDAALGQLRNPSPYNSDEVKAQYDWLAGDIDDDFSQRERSLDESMARRGLYGSAGKDFHSGRLSDLNVGQRSAKTSLARDLANKYATSFGDYNRNAITQGQNVSGQANNQSLDWLKTLFGYGQQGFDNDMQSAEFNARRDDEYNRLLQMMLQAGYG